MSRVGIYPGSFDPVTNGHFDIIKRASKLLDKLYVVVSYNIKKVSLFSHLERVEMIKEITKDMPNVEVTSYEGLSVTFAQEKGATVIIRGIRAISDFENEFKLFSFNKDLGHEMETIILLANASHMFLASSEIKEICQFGGDVSHYVPPCVETNLKMKFESLKKQ